MMRRRTAHLMKNARFLGRRAKQMIMVLSDVIAMPAALWTAFLLHTGTISSDIRANSWLYAATILFTVPVFTRLGLYRAVIRFLGIHAALAIALGVSVSTVSLLLINQFFLRIAGADRRVRDLLRARGAVCRRFTLRRARTAAHGQRRRETGGYLRRRRGRRAVVHLTDRRARTSGRWRSWMTTRNFKARAFAACRCMHRTSCSSCAAAAACNWCSSHCPAPRAAGAAKSSKG